MFSDRIEIISPGHLPNHLTIEKIKAGNSNIRNPILASYVAKGLLPYRGLGTGIRRAFEDWDQIELESDPEACTFKATIQRLKVHKEAIATGKTAMPVDREPINEPINELQVNILKVIKTNPAISYDALATQLGKGRSTIMRQINGLKTLGLIHRTGSRKTGRWEIIPQKQDH